MFEQAIHAAATIIREADGLLICAGAGMGVDSGLPDFRGNEGFWQAYPALAKSGYDFGTVASPRTFEADPALAWGFYGHRLNLYRKTLPNAGFDILQRWAQRMQSGWFVVTSNVDGQFQTAGFDGQRMYEVHGSIHYLQCTKPCTGETWPADAFNPEVNDDECRLTNAWPRCPHCRRMARPNILMFGDWQWVDTPTRIQQRVFGHWVNRVERLAIVEIGAGTAIQTIRMVSESQGVKSRLIRINPREATIPLGVRGVSLATNGLSALQAMDALMADG